MLTLSHRGLFGLSTKVEDQTARNRNADEKTQKNGTMYMYASSKDSDQLGHLLSQISLLDC